MTTNANAAPGRAAQAAIVRALDLFHDSQSVKRRHTPTMRAEYDPNTAARRCSRCGQRGQWRRVWAIGGGWTCCGFDDADLRHGDLAHTCTWACAAASA